MARVRIGRAKSTKSQEVESWKKEAIEHLRVEAEHLRSEVGLLKANLDATTELLKIEKEKRLTDAAERQRAADKALVQQMVAELRTISPDVILSAIRLENGVFKHSAVAAADLRKLFAALDRLYSYPRARVVD